MKYIYLIFLGLLINVSVLAQGEEREVHILQIDGAIAPAYTDYMKRGIDKATVANAELIVIELNTPGGLLTSTRQMVSKIMTSEVPVAVYVTPTGAHAASAGTFILMAAHIAAMDQGTNVGAATPVQMRAGMDSLDGLPTKQPSDDMQIEDIIRQMDDPNAENLQRKAMEDTTAFIRSIAEMRGRNAEWAEKAVTDAESITAKEALEKNVIDIVAPSRDDLIKQINGRTVKMKDGRERTLNTENVRIIETSPDLMTRFLALISDPNVAAILMMIGIYGLVLEFYAPGTMVSGTIGAICLLLAFYAFSILPVTGLGAMLIVSGLVFMFAEIFIPSFGVLGIAGIIALTIGFAIMFDDSQMLGMGLEWQIIMGIIVSAAIFMGIGFLLFVKSVINKELKTGPESMIGQQAKVMDWDGHSGHVFTNGERWQAFSPEVEDTFSKDDIVLISAVNGLKLKVRATRD